MTKYSVLPSVPLNPLNEADLVVAAAQKIYEASNGRINNFSANSPTMALIEGQAFAGAELLYYLNQLPEAVVLEWLGPLLGIQRKLGTPSKSTLEVNIAPHGDVWVLKAGFLIRTNTSITGEEAVAFTTDTDLIIPAQQSQGFVNITSIDVGSNQNVEANLITNFEESLAFLRSVRNVTPATGGTDEETLNSVKQRAFSYIRRRNPVSKQDWVEYITNLIGEGSIVLVKNRRPELEDRNTDSPFAANHVSFFLLGPNGAVLSNAELASVSDKIDSHLPVNVQGHVYNIDIQDVDVVVRVSYNPATRGGSLKEFSAEIHEAFTNYFKPNNFFDMGEEIQVWDLITLFAQDFAYVSPNIESLDCYSTPANLSSISPQWENWATGKIYLKDELIQSNGLFYRVINDFDPVGTDPADQVNDGLLQFNRVKDWDDFPHRLNDVVLDDQDNYYLVLDNVTGEDPIIGNNITAGRVSNIKTPVYWVAGTDLLPGDLVFSTDPNGTPYEYEMYVVKEALTVVNSGSIADAELSGLISQTTPLRLNQGDSYVVGNYVFVANRFASYDYYKVLNDFSYGNLSSPFQEVYKGNIKRVIVHSTTPATFRGRKYKARFKVGEFLEYTDNNIYQVGRDFTPNGASLVEMISDRRLYRTGFTTNPEFGSISQFEMLGDPAGYSILLNDVVISSPIINNTLTDGEGESLVIQFDMQRGRWDIANLNIIAPGGGYEVGDIVVIQPRLLTTMEMDKPIYLEVETIDINGGITELKETPGQASSITYLRRLNITGSLLSFAINSRGVDGSLRFDLIFDSPFSFTGFINNFTLDNSGDGYAQDELLYLDLEEGDLDTYVTSLVGQIQLRVDEIVSNFDFSYRQFHKVLEGDLVKDGDRVFTSMKDFTPTIDGLEYYVDNNVITEVLSPTFTQTETAKELFLTPVVSNIPSPLIALPGLVLYDNKASIYATTSNAFDGNDGTFWESRERGAAVANTSFVGLDLGFESYITGINFTNTVSINPLEPTTSSFTIQYSLKGPDGPWFSVGNGTNVESVQVFTGINIQARYWRFIADGANNPHANQPWRISNIEFFGDIENVIERREDFILYTDNNTTTIYRVMNTFTPELDTNPRDEEFRGNLLKLVVNYENNGYIKPRSDYSGFDIGWLRIDFHPHGSPEQITRYVIENKLGTDLVYSYEPGNTSGPVIDYKDGTFAL